MYNIQTKIQMIIYYKIINLPLKIADTKIQVRQRFGKAKSFNIQFRLNSPMHNKNFYP